MPQIEHPEVHGTCALWLAIRRDTGKGMVLYQVIHLDPDPEVGYPAIRLRKTSGESFDLIRGPHGWTCECQDFVHRREGTGQPCKHLASARKQRLI